jgi:hypothetical protein
VVIPAQGNGAIQVARHAQHKCAAFEVGYESASQFNREYSRFFGQPQMRDIRTLRGPDAPALESLSRQWPQPVVPVLHLPDFCRH